jgi:hypothetical protein
MDYDTIIRDHEAEARLLYDQATAAMRAGDFERGADLDRRSTRALELATWARGCRFKAEAQGSG